MISSWIGVVLTLWYSIFHFFLFPFLLRKLFLISSDPTNEDIEEVVEYDLEPEDYEFIDKIAEIIGPKKLTENKLEYIMDRLEKESARLVPRFFILF